MKCLAAFIALIMIALPLTAEESLKWQTLTDFKEFLFFLQQLE